MRDLDLNTNSVGGPQRPASSRRAHGRGMPVAAQRSGAPAVSVTGSTGSGTDTATHIPFSPPLIGEEEIAEVVDTLRSDWITTGPKTAAFEREFAQYLSARGALALNSCTAGLHSALLVSGVGKGDEVITTPLTFAASVNVIEHVGARPVLVDVEPDTLNIDPEAVAAAITDRTRAVLPVHYAGHPADLDAIDALTRDRGITVVEDAAHALPALYKGRKIGSGGNPVAFSFYATKNLTTGEGGMLTGDPEFLARARVLSLHGLSQDAQARYDAGGDWHYEILAPGFKYNMSDIQAALGLWQLRKLESFQARRRAIVAAYTEAFCGEPALRVPIEREEVQHAWHLYALQLRPEALRIDRDQFVRELQQRNIGVSVHFIPIHVHPYYRDKYGYAENDLPIAYQSYRRLFSLPLSARLTDHEVTTVIEAVLAVANQYRR